MDVKRLDEEVKLVVRSCLLGDISIGNGMAKKATSFVTSRGRKAGARASGGVF